ncbi:MAG TPA: hypothetical protein EYH18_02070 [Aquifex sp.]|nr:hypothetical protein [Aquifex sp.]
MGINNFLYMTFIVGHRKFEKNLDELYIGSSVVAGNPDSVRDKETREKGKPFSKPIYKVLDNLTLVEVYKGFQVFSNVAGNVVYEILYDALEGEVKGILCGVKEEEGISYYALITKETKSVKKQIAFYIDYVDFGLLPAIQKEIEETLQYDEGKIKEVYGNPPERIYAGSFIGSTDEGIVLVPFSTYKVNEVIPAYTGEEDERISYLEVQIEEINSELTKLDRESEEYKKLSEKRRELLRELTKLRNKLYNPDILKAVRSKGDRLFVTQKPEIRYLGENLLSTAYAYKDLTLGQAKRIKGVYAVLTLPTYNNLSKKLQKGYLELFLCLSDEGDLFPMELTKARQTIAVMDEALKELIRSLETGTKPQLSPLKERIKDNLSLRKRIEDLEKFVLPLVGEGGEITDETLNFLREIKGELELSKRILYSPFTIGKLVTLYELLSLLQEAGLDTSGLTKEGWSEIYETLELVNENLENTFKTEFKQEIEALVRFFLKRIEERKPIHYKLKIKGTLQEGFYPSKERGLEVIDLYPNRVLQTLIKTALRRLNSLDKLLKLEEIEVFFGGNTVRLGSLALTAFVRKVFSSVAKTYMANLDFNRQEEIESLKSYLIQNWLGEYRKSAETEQPKEGEIVEIEGFDNDIFEMD